MFPIRIPIPHIPIPVHGGGGVGLIGLLIALAVCVLTGVFVWQSFTQPVSTAQRVIAAGLLVFLFGGIIAIAYATT